MLIAGVGCRAAAFVAVAVFVGGCGGVESVSSTAQQPSPDQAEREGRALRTGVITQGQASRVGVEAGQSCDSDEMSSYIENQLGEPSPVPLGGYLTDNAGHASWGQEYSGEGYAPESTRNGPLTRALCWYEGDFTVPTYAEPDETAQMPYVILEQRLDGDGPAIVATSPTPLPLLAPSAPEGAGNPSGRRAQAQPPGVRVVPGDAAAPKPRASREPRRGPSPSPTS